MRALLLGFLLQAVGYTLGLATATGGDRDGSIAASVVGVLLCGAAIIAVLGFWKLRRADAVKSVLVGVACHDEQTGAELNVPSATLLVAFGRELGYELGEDETTPEGQDRYARRVFGVSAVRHAEEHAKN